MAGIRLSDSENNTVMHALSLYMWFLSQPDDKRPNYHHNLKREELEEEAIRARQVYDRAYWHMRKQAGY